MSSRGQTVLRSALQPADDDEGSAVAAGCGATEA